MSRIEQVIKRARDTLADSSGERWSDERLVRLVSEAQQDIAKHTQMLKAQTTLYLIPGVRTYSLPSNLWVITRAEFDNCVIELVTHEQLDRAVRTQQTQSYRDVEYSRDYEHTIPESCWETDTSSKVEALIYDKRNLHEVSVYPVPDDSVTQNSYDFESDDVEFVGAELYGVVTGIDNYTLSSTYGVVTELYDPQTQNENFYGAYGVTVGVNETDNVVKLWYVLVPDDISLITDELTVPSIWDTAIKHYVVGHAFDDDFDTRYQEKSAKALALYERELGVSSKFERQNNVRTSQRKTTYRGAFD